MHKLRLLYCLAAMACLVSFTGCDKDDDDDVSPNVSLLTAGEWKGSAIYMDEDNITAEFEQQTEIDISNYVSLFQRDGSYTDTYDGTVVAEGDWEYANNERVIVFDKGTSTEYEVVISKLNENELFYVQSGLEFRFVR